MSAQLINGTEISRKILADVKAQLQMTKAKNPNFNSVLAIVQVGSRLDSNIYIAAKLKTAAEIGAEGRLFKYNKDVTQRELEKEIDRLNKDENIDGILVQLPLDCNHMINVDAIVDRIDPTKDVDGLTQKNAGRLIRGELDNAIIPCTTKGCFYLVQEATGDPNYVEGKNVVVVGRSKIVGSPAAAFFSWKNATTTLCHSKTTNLKEHCQQADILIVAIGKKHFVKGNWIKPGAIVIDCGINVEPPVETGKKNRIYGDVDFEVGKKKAGYITPVPGGVGPITVAILIQNTYDQAVRRRLHPSKIEKTIV